MQEVNKWFADHLDKAARSKPGEDYFKDNIEW